MRSATLHVSDCKANGQMKAMPFWSQNCFAKAFPLCATLPFLVAVSLAGCAAVGQQNIESASSIPYFHERLSEQILRDGYPHKIISERSDHAYLDSIHIRLPADSVKRQHEGLERLLADIAKMCLLPEYSGVQVFIVVNAVDASDGQYVRRTLETRIADRSNLSVVVLPSAVDGLVVSVRQFPRNAER